MRTLLRFVRRYGQPYWRWYLAGFVALLVTNGLSVAIPVELGRGIDALVEGQAGRPSVVRSAAVVALMGLALIGVRTASRLLFFTPGRWIECELQHDLFAALLSQQPDFYARFPQGDLATRLTSDVQALRLLFGFTLLGLANTMVAIVLAAGQMSRLSPVLTLLCMVPLVVGFAITTTAANRLRKVARRMQDELAAISDHALASFQGIAAVHAFQVRDALLEKFRGPNQALERSSIERATLRVAIGPVLAVAAGVDVFLLLWFGGPVALNGDLSVGEIIAFTALVGFLAGPLRSLTFTLAVTRQAQASIERLDEILASPPRRTEGTHPAPCDLEAPPRLEFRGLGFSYGDAAAPALSEVTATVQAGGVLGVFGPTGSGKTTLVRCLMRLEDPPSGTVFIDGVDVRSLDLDAWRRRAALVPQRAFLFSESVRDNILLGRDPEKLPAVLRAAQLEVDLQSLPFGVDTVVGEAGLTLSGGQRQRAALARGLAAAAPMLVLDDVLSAVDPTTERALINAIAARAPRPTTVIVANRIAALAHADVIVVLDDGRMVDAGTHAELIDRPGRYRETWIRQSEGAP